MPKVVHASEYKERINDLETEVTTLKRRLEELRKAKNQTYIRREKIMYRIPPRKLPCTDDPPTSAPPSLPVVLSTAQAVPDDKSDKIVELNQKITRLTNELELAKLKYHRDTSFIQNIIAKLKADIHNLREDYQKRITDIISEHSITIEKIRREHTEELALYFENSENDKKARDDMEVEVEEWRAKCKRYQNVDIEELKAELLALKSSHETMKSLHKSEILTLEGNITELLEIIASQKDRRYQLIPDRPYTVKKIPCSKPDSFLSKDAKPVFAKTSHLCGNVNANVKIQRPRSCAQRKPIKVETQPERPKTCSQRKCNKKVNNSKDLYQNVSSKVDTKIVNDDLVDFYKGRLFHPRYKRAFGCSL